MPLYPLGIHSRVRQRGNTSNGTPGGQNTRPTTGHFGGDLLGGPGSPWTFEGQPVQQVSTGQKQAGALPLGPKGTSIQRPRGLGDSGHIHIWGPNRSGVGNDFATEFAHRHTAHRATLSDNRHSTTAGAIPPTGGRGTSQRKDPLRTGASAITIWTPRADTTTRALPATKHEEATWGHPAGTRDDPKHRHGNTLSPPAHTRRGTPQPGRGAPPLCRHQNSDKTRRPQRHPTHEEETPRGHNRASRSPADGGGKKTRPPRRNGSSRATARANSPQRQQT